MTDNSDGIATTPDQSDLTQKELIERAHYFLGNVY